MTEYMDIVNEKNEVIGKTTKEEIYAKKLSHRIVHVFVINPKTKEVYFQQRAKTVSFLPGYYCTSAGGHVRAGETYAQAAQRELKEELGLDTPIQKAADLEFESDNHKRLMQLFLAFADKGFHFDDGEVAHGSFLSIDQAHSLVVNNEKIHPQLAVCMQWLYNNRNMLRN